MVTFAKINPNRQLILIYGFYHSYILCQVLEIAAFWLLLLSFFNKKGNFQAF